MLHVRQVDNGDTWFLGKRLGVVLQALPVIIGRGLDDDANDIELDHRPPLS